MPSTYSTSLRIELPGIGEQTNTWGTTLNTGLGTILEQAITGYQSVAMTDADYTLVASNGAADEARNAVIKMTGVLTANRNVICPTVEKLYIIDNSTTGGFSITLKPAAGTGISITNGKRRYLYCDGTNVLDAINDLPSGTNLGGVEIVTLSAAQVLTNKTLTTPTMTIVDGNFSVLGSGDATKIMKFEVDGFTTATTRTVTVPDASFTMVGADTAQTLTNKTITINDNLFTIQGSADTTKKINFEVDGLTTATTKTITAPDANITIGSSPLRNAQTGTTYTIVADDRGKHITLSNAGTIAVTLPQGTTSFGNGWYTVVENIGAGIATITPTTSTINGAASIKIGQGEAVRISSDGTNYRAIGLGGSYTGITGLIEDTAPDYANDYVATAELSSLTAKKVKLSALSPSGALASKTTDYTATTSDRGKSIRFAGLSASVTLTLPPAASCGDGFILYVSNEDTTDIAPFGMTVDPNGAELIDGVSARKGYMGTRVTLLCDGTGWRTVGGRWRYYSGDQTITLAGQLVLAHGLGVRPRSVLWYELRCTTADLNYSVNDIVSNCGDGTDGGFSTNYAATYDATNITIRLSAQGFFLCNKTTGSCNLLTAASWKIRYYVED